jgi:hypothetical protein
MKSQRMIVSPGDTVHPELLGDFGVGTTDYGLCARKSAGAG